MSQRRQRVLVEPDHVVVRKLKEDPGSWYAIADTSGTSAHTLSQVSYRIKNNRQAAFRRSPAGVFESKVRTNGDVTELLARFLPGAGA